MGNKRQRLARKKFEVVTGGDAQPKQKAVESKDVVSSENDPKQGKKKKKLAGKKRKVLEGHEIARVAQPDAAVGQDHGGKVSKENGAPVKSTSFNESQISGLNGIQKKTKDDTGNKKLGSKHPLRIPGMRPGEGCFICKGTDHIAKLCPTKNARDRKKLPDDQNLTLLPHL